MVTSGINEKSKQFADSLEELSNSQDLFIVFIDLCDSTLFKQSCKPRDLPEFHWIARQKFFLVKTASIVTNYGGEIVKTIGDEIMATFPSSKNPIEILLCIKEISAVFETSPLYKTKTDKIKIKSSIDFGTCFDGTVTKTDVFDPIGTAVDRCARISKGATQNSIVFTEELYETILQIDNKFFESEDFELSLEKDDFKGLGEINFYRLAFK